MPVEPKSLKPRGPEEILQELLAMNIRGESSIETLNNEAVHADRLAELYKPEQFESEVVEKYWDPDPASRFRKLSQTLTKMQATVAAGKSLNTETVNAEDRQALAGASTTLQKIQIYARDGLSDNDMGGLLPPLPAGMAQARDKALGEILGGGPDAVRDERVQSVRKMLAEIARYDTAMKLADELCASLGIKPERGAGAGLAG